MLKFAVSIALSFLLISTQAQNLDVLKDGKLIGAFSTSIGSKNGISIKADKVAEGYKIILTGEEAWAGIYLQYQEGKRDEAKPLADLSSYKYMVMKIKSEEPIVVDKIGLGEDGELVDFLYKVKLDKEWQMLIMQLPEGVEKQNSLFSFVTVGKAEVTLAELYYTATLPQIAGDNVRYFIPAQEERLENVKYIYSESFENGAPSGYSGEENGISMNVNMQCKESPYRGRHCVRIDVDNKETWRALFLQYTGKWTNSLTKEDKLLDLRPYKKLVFYARSPEKGYMIPEVGFGGESLMFSQEQRNIVFVKLTNEWQRFEIDIRGLDRASVNDVMMFVLNEGTFYLDEIRFEK